MLASVNASSTPRNALVLNCAGEWRTVVLLLLVFSSWLLLTWYWSELPLPLLALGGSLCLALFGSLQHEAIHGHPTANRGLNLALVWPPLWLWLPLRIYDQTHRAHHENPLTMPQLDPESWYIRESEWKNMSRVRRWLSLANQTFAGRMFFGPWIALVQCWRFILFEMPNDGRKLAMVAAHAAGVFVIYLWVSVVVQMPFYIYVLLFAWPGTSLAMMRSFMEHRFHENPEFRTIMVKGCPLTRLLFLNNNYHCVHHRYPELAWYKVARVYRRRVAEFEGQNGGFNYSGYAQIAWRFLFRPWTSPVLPDTVRK